MGVLTCGRVGCENIMCAHYSEEYGYLCCDCLQELKEEGACDIQDFMVKPKQCSMSFGEDWYDYIDGLFESRY